VGGFHDAVLRHEAERLEEFWFGRGFAWIEEEGGGLTLRCSLLVEVPRLVARTKRRDLEERFSVGFCDPYTYTGCGLMGLFLARLGKPSTVRRKVEIEFVSYPERPHAGEIASRLFAPLGYTVSVSGGRLRLHGEQILRDVFTELPSLLLAVDRKARLFFSPEELSDIRGRNDHWVSAHPARRAIELALKGRPTPLRLLVPPGSVERNIPAKEDVEKIEILGEKPIKTGLVERVQVASSQREHASRMFGRMNIDPRWLIYLPAAVASVQEESSSGELERPEGALNYYCGEQIKKVVVEQKHMGSRGIVILCQSSKAALGRFGIDADVPGIAYTRNGRRFFSDEDTEAVFLQRLEETLNRSNFWKRFSTDWVCFDGEILPWTIKAAESSEESDLVTTGSAAIAEIRRALTSGVPSELKTYWRTLIENRGAALSKYDGMFQRYRSEAANLAALRFAPFHLLAVESHTFFHRSHLWHMQTLNNVARSGNGFVIPTRYEVVETPERSTWEKTLAWWEQLSSESEEGLVVKPLPFVPQGRRGFAQPALKCRSREHLRLVYGPDYDSTETRELLSAREAFKKRRQKHRRIRQQFALSMEAVNRFVQREPLNAVHECVLSVLGLEVAQTAHH
jgi:hypothetical protein